MSNVFEEKAMAEMNEAMETREIAADAEAEALEQMAEQTDTPDTENIDIPENIADVLQLTDEEKAAYSNIGKSISDMPSEGGIIGYKSGICNGREIPIYS